MQTKFAAGLAALALIALPGWTPSTPASFALGAAQAQTAEAEAAAEPAAEDAPLYREMSLGNPDAAVTVIEYASFTCPHCASFHSTVMPELRENYIDTGLVHFINREVYFDAYGLWAGMLARCGGGERYFGIVDMLYETQREWAGSSDGAQVAENLRRMGRVAGFTTEEVNACLENRAMAEALVAEYQTNATADGIRGTPSFVINGTLYSNMSYAEFSEILDGLLED